MLYLCIYMFCTYCVCVCVCLCHCPSLSLSRGIYILCIDVIDMYKITSLYDVICVCITFPHYICIYIYMYVHIYIHYLYIYIYTNTHAHVNPPYDRTKDIRIRSPPIPGKNHPCKK